MPPRRSCSLEHVLLGGHSPRREGKRRRAVRDPLLHLGMAVDDDDRRVEVVVRETELYVPEFTWDPIPGAAKYEVEINSVFDFPERSLEGLLRLVRLADHDDLHPEGDPPEQHVLLARMRDQRARRGRRLERRTRHSTRRSPTTRSWTSRGSRTCACATRATREPTSMAVRLATRRSCRSSPGIPFPGPRATRSTSGRTTPASTTATSEPQSSSALALDDRDHLLDSAWPGAGSQAVPVGPGASSDSRNLVVRTVLLRPGSQPGAGRVNLSAPTSGATSRSSTTAPAPRSRSPASDRRRLQLRAATRTTSAHDDYLLPHSRTTRSPRRPTRSSCGTRSRASSPTG